MAKRFPKPYVSILCSSDRKFQKHYTSGDYYKPNKTQSRALNFTDVYSDTNIPTQKSPVSPDITPPCPFWPFLWSKDESDSVGRSKQWRFKLLNIYAISPRAALDRSFTHPVPPTELMHGVFLRYGKSSSSTAPIRKSATSARVMEPACICRGGIVVRY